MTIKSITVSNLAPRRLRRFAEKTSAPKRQKFRANNGKQFSRN